MLTSFVYNFWANRTIPFIHISKELKSNVLRIWNYTRIYFCEFVISIGFVVPRHIEFFFKITTLQLVYRPLPLDNKRICKRRWSLIVRACDKKVLFNTIQLYHLFSENIYEIIDEKKAHFEKNDTTQHSVALSDLSPSSADIHTLTNTWKLHKLYLENGWIF